MKFVVVNVMLLLCSWVFSQENGVVWMHKNNGQWDSEINYMVELTDGALLLDDKGFTFNLYEMPKRHEHEEEDSHVSSEIKQQVVTSHFINSAEKFKIQASDSSNFYRNYFIGTDKSKWKSSVRSYTQVKYEAFYPKIDLLFSGRGGMKYSFVASPGADVSVVQQKIDGANTVFIDREGQLHYTTYFGEVIEESPKAWTISKGKRKEVSIRFQLDGTIVSYKIGKYNDQDTLVIDPSLTFSTFTGSSANNWGTTATPDADGNLIGGGTVFATGGTYPTTPGAFSSTHGGGTIDVGITKFTADGSNLIYSTYLGGQGSDAPNSMISAPNGELYIFGVTSSNNFPMAGNSYSTLFKGGPALTQSQANSLGFTQGVDLFVARLSIDGTSLLSSTYVGGSGTDGVNHAELKFNYGDQFRGEITLDAQNNVYVASTTMSSDFPVVIGTQGALNGLQDAVLFKLSPNLSNMLFSTYYGGENRETGNSVQIASNGDVYMAGGTSSLTLPVLAGQDVSFNGGASDGYVSRFSGTTGTMLSGTYIGKNEADQLYFVQLDIDDAVYVFGQTQSDWAITPGKYGIPNSGQIIRKYSSNLSTEIWTTMIGSGIGGIEISPTAFLVSDCYDIYLSGWGGNLNKGSSPYTSQSTSNGFPVTSDAYQLTTNGNNFYIGILGSDATTLKYATYMGGLTGPDNHVDGGTSRFDKKGRIYHAVCASCGTNLFDGFPTTPGAWSNLAPSTGFACNMACFKFDLNVIDAIVSAPNTIVCLPDPVIFSNNSANGNSFTWDFGDNTTSNEENPTHYYTSPGTYTVTLVVADTNNCFTLDSVIFEINIGEFLGGIVDPPGPICPGTSYQLEAYNGIEYEWFPAQYLDDPTSPTPIATVDQTTDFTVIITDSCGADTLEVTLEVYIDAPLISPDTSICIGNSVQLEATGGVSYSWQPTQTLSNPSISNPIATPTNDTEYTVEITTFNNCILYDTVLIDVYYTPPVPVIPDTLNICPGESVAISVSGADTYLWSPNSNISTVMGPNVVVNPDVDFTYYCDFTNACGTALDSVFIDVVTSSIVAGTDTVLCPGESTTLWATGGVSYYWTPTNSLNNPTLSQVVATPTENTTYIVNAIDLYGCTSSDTVYVTLYPPADIDASPNVYAFYGDEVVLSATTTTMGPIEWSPTEYLSCVVCPQVVATPNQDYTYYVSYVDENGCTAVDSVHIFYDAQLFVPNTFTPGGVNSFNSYFQATGGNIETFQMDIYNRWGELIVTLNSLDEFWDGTYQGFECQDGTYVWKVKYTDKSNREFHLAGHVNLLRD